MDGPKHGSLFCNLESAIASREQRDYHGRAKALLALLVVTALFLQKLRQSRVGIGGIFFLFLMVFFDSLAEFARSSDDPNYKPCYDADRNRQQQ